MCSFDREAQFFLLSALLTPAALLINILHPVFALLRRSVDLAPKRHIKITKKLMSFFFDPRIP